MYQQFEGSFDSIGKSLPLEHKWGPKTKILSKDFISFDLSRRPCHFSVFVCQNWIKNGQVMSMQSAHAKVALAFLGHEMDIFATFCDI